MRICCLLVLTLLLLAASGIAHLSGTVAAAPPANPAATDYVAGELIVQLRAGLTVAPDGLVSSSSQAVATDSVQINQLNQINQLLRELGVAYAEPVRDTTFTLGFDTAPAVPQSARLLAAHPAVVYAEPNYIRTMQREPNDPILREQWALRNIQAFDAWDITTGSGIVIAVIDTGVSSSHPDLGDHIRPGYNAVNGSDRTEDDVGHGTAIAGLIAARTDNGEGIAGMCWDCAILPVKVLRSNGTGSDDDIARGIYWATDAGARIINMSLGGRQDTQVLRNAVEYAYSRGVLIVTASGNSRQRGNTINYPAAYPQVIAVGATGNGDQITGFSNTGDHIDMSAPGVGLWTTLPGGEYGGTINGTSFSSPYVAGTAALVFSVRPDLSHDAVKCILEASADDRGAPGWDPEFGWGRLNAFRAVELAQRFTTCPLNTAAQPGDTPATVPATPSAFVPVQPVASTPDLTYFPETGHTLQGAFKAYWEQNGGLPVFGFPISEEFVEQGDDGRDYTVQYFERHRFERHPANPPPYNVQLTRLGPLVLETQSRSWYTFPRGQPRDGCLFFEATGHTLCEPFLSAWQANGLEFDRQPGTSYEESLALFGQPLSEPQVEEVAPGLTITVQWFERARFENHNGQVLLGLLSSELVDSRGWR